MRKLSHRELESLSQGHTAGRDQGCDLQMEAQAVCAHLHRCLHVTILPSSCPRLWICSWAYPLNSVLVPLFHSKLVSAVLFSLVSASSRFHFPLIRCHVRSVARTHMPPGGAEFTSQTAPPWPAGCPCPIDHRRPKVRDTFTCEEVLRSRIGKALGFHGRNAVYLFLPFVSQSQGNRGTLKISRKLLLAALPCSELQNGVFAEPWEMGRTRMCGLGYTLVGLEREEDPLSSLPPRAPGKPPFRWGLGVSPTPASDGLPGDSQGPGHLC